MARAARVYPADIAGPRLGMPIKSVRITRDCILCRRASDLHPLVFVVPEDATQTSLRPGVDLAAHEAEILEAAGGCPTGSILVEWE